MSSALRDGSVGSVTQIDGCTVQSAVKVGSEMRSRQLAGYVAVTSPGGGDMLAFATAAHRSLVRCRDVGCQTTLLPSRLSPTILLLLIVAEKLLPVVSELAVRSSRIKKEITPCSIGAGCPFFMY